MLVVLHKTGLEWQKYTILRLAFLFFSGFTINGLCHENDLQ